MRNTTDYTNWDSADSDYLSGKARDKTLSVAGTKVNTSLIGDLFQTIWKAVRFSGISPNGNPDNETNGYQMHDALAKSFTQTTDWVTVSTFTNNYAQGSTYGKLKYRKSNGYVEILGSVDVSTGTNQTAIFTLPVGFRPVGTSIIYCDGYLNDASRLPIEVASNGEVRFRADSFGGGSGLLNIRFTIQDQS